MNGSLHTHQHRVSFGDCDPAGIAYYPNIFKWVDTTCHSWFWVHGGHAALCKALGATGIGLMDSTAKFRSPLRDGDTLHVHITGFEWGRKTLTIHYQGMVDTRLAFEATETRGLFMPGDKGLYAGEMSALRALVLPDER